ncbi:MAG TPA: hemolysin family protein [Clostridiales bacterium]|nr:hemolysin family protein [Clostridiales bacterium]HQP70299.1 hemolysin family protein [Clostridiales bacterium]
MDSSLSMEPPSSYLIFFQLIGFIALLCCSFFFSATETAFVSLNNSDLNDIRNSKEGNFAKITGLIAGRSEFLLLTLLIGNNLANVSIATIAALITRDLFMNTGYETLSMFFEVIIIGLLILLTGEIIPKTYAIRNKVKFIKRVSPFVIFIYYLLFPITYIIEKIVNIFIGKIKKIDTVSEYTRQDIENLMEAGGEDGALEEDEKNMINSIFEFSEKTAKEIMVPRVDIMAIPADITSKDLFSFINENNFSRIPVYKNNIDNIIGILYIKDLLHHINSLDENLNIARILREVTFIPESKDIADLLKMFQKEKTHIAIVVDEYGGTSGMITLEDIIEEIVGEIQDEFDEEERLYRRINDTSYEFDAKIPINDLNEILELNLPENEDYESLGGYLYDLFGEVPDVGDKKSYNGCTFTILSVHKQRIGWVGIEKNVNNNEKQNTEETK